MKVNLFGHDSEILRPLVEGAGFDLVEKEPDIVVCYGGDGTLLRAERMFPGVPKLPLRDSKVCKLCTNLGNEEALRRVWSGEYRTINVLKIRARYKGEVQWALNDVVVSHSAPTHAIRFTISVNGRPYARGREIIGDGIVAATPFGSGAYYRSITDGTFSTGLGLAFNNSTEQVDHIVLKESDEITFTLTRGAALFAVDIEGVQEIKEGESIIITAAPKEESAKIISFGEEFTYWAES